MSTPTENLSRDTAAVAESLSVMMEKELTSYSCEGYLNPADPTMITATDRQALVDWCYIVVDLCQFSRETVASAMNMVDRFLSTPGSSSSTANEALHDQTLFQLLIVTALYVSIKVNERVVMSSAMFAEIIRKVYTVQEIESMERTLLRGLSWRCYAPTACQVGHSILSLILPHTDISEATWGFLVDEMNYLIEFAVRDYYLSTQRASTIALAAILNAMKCISDYKRIELLEALPRIIKCFDFDHTKIVFKASERLQQLFQDSMEEEIIDVPESSKYNTERRTSVIVEC